MVYIPLELLSYTTLNHVQGTIYYTSHNYWKNPFLTTAEIFRVTEDFGRFQLPIRLFKRPVLGWMHGSFILINGAVENKVTWDTGCLAEDFWFAFHVCDLVTSTSQLLI